MDVDDVALNVISELNTIARNYDHHEYGLPVSSGELEKMKAVVAAAVREAVAAERERIAVYLDDSAAKFRAMETGRLDPTDTIAVETWVECVLMSAAKRLRGEMGNTVPHYTDPTAPAHADEVK
jgi:hypothetical protein